MEIVRGVIENSANFVYGKDIIEVYSVKSQSSDWEKTDYHYRMKLAIGGIDTTRATNIETTDSRGNKTTTNVLYVDINNFRIKEYSDAYIASPTGMEKSQLGKTETGEVNSWFATKYPDGKSEVSRCHAVINNKEIIYTGEIKKESIDFRCVINIDKDLKDNTYTLGYMYFKTLSEGLKLTITNLVYNKTIPELKPETSPYDSLINKIKQVYFNKFPTDQYMLIDSLYRAEAYQMLKDYFKQNYQNYEEAPSYQVIPTYQEINALLLADVEYSEDRVNETIKDILKAKGLTKDTKWIIEKKKETEYSQDIPYVQFFWNAFFRLLAEDNHGFTWQVIGLDGNYEYQDRFITLSYDDTYYDQYISTEKIEYPNIINDDWIRKQIDSTSDTSLLSWKPLPGFYGNAIVPYESISLNQDIEELFYSVKEEDVSKCLYGWATQSPKYYTSFTDNFNNIIEFLGLAGKNIIIRASLYYIDRRRDSQLKTIKNIYYSKFLNVPPQREVNYLELGRIFDFDGNYLGIKINDKKIQIGVTNNYVLRNLHQGDIESINILKGYPVVVNILSDVNYQLGRTLKDKTTNILVYHGQVRNSIDSTIPVSIDTNILKEVSDQIISDVTSSSNEGSIFTPVNNQYYKYYYETQQDVFQKFNFYLNTIDFDIEVLDTIHDEPPYIIVNDKKIYIGKENHYVGQGLPIDGIYANFYYQLTYKITAILEKEDL